MTIAHDNEAIELTRDETLAYLRARVHRAHRMSLEEYIEAKRRGTLARVPGDAALEVFAGDLCAAGTTLEGDDRSRG